MVLSTTYSIKGTLSIEHIYDYLIVDEASQVDLATGVLAFSCARNIVIVGDLKQLPNVLTEDDIRTSDAIWQKYSLDERYRFSTHSLLSSALEIWQDAPVTLLREHYRCHPKIINFCNQKFDHGQLIVMTKDHDEPDVLTMYRTIAGNHARGHLNQRQIDVIQQEVLPRLHQQMCIRDRHKDDYAALVQSQQSNDQKVMTGFDSLKSSGVLTEKGYTYKDKDTKEISRITYSAEDPNDFYRFHPNALDIGFRVLKLDDTNMKDVYYRCV